MTELESRVRELEYRMQSMEKNQNNIISSVKTINAELGKIINGINTIKYVSIGVAIYYVADNMGITSAIKLAKWGLGL